MDKIYLYVNLCSNKTHLTYCVLHVKVDLFNTNPTLKLTCWCKGCSGNVPRTDCEGEGAVRAGNGTCWDTEGGMTGVWNDTLLTQSTGIYRRSPAEIYWK